jgi:hypothetical protein
MNILTTVFTLLMVMAILTYARLETFLEHAGFQREYRNFITEKERAPYNEAQEKLLKEGKSTTEPKGGKHLKYQINFDLLLDKTKRENQQEAYLQTRELLKKLMEFLYGSHRFLQELKEKRPTLIDELLDRIMQVADKEIYQGKIKRVGDLSTLQLEDPELQDLLYHVLKGSRDKLKYAEEYREKEGYLSLTNFITVEDTNRLISVYLAPGEILMALYGDTTQVEEVFAIREDLFREREKRSQENGINAILSKKFADALSGRSFLGSKENLLLDFSVSGTNPKQYR